MDKGTVQAALVTMIVAIIILIVFVAILEAFRVISGPSLSCLTQRFFGIAVCS